ncbi:PfkB family carbohydrate kinase [Streptomyces sp. NPDC088354]|uniref:PfkB family carbohydrate kinase n=1 Tax=unclassified Streptomyces TaxID=2593676 RepID=UPI0029A00D2C|nr:PfkB family carbohydrate kinase [Streptomyces sp. MI02-7b]MDX3073567.1 PfkB family carbohydrate kinase [Streptomyces sp. MI02-7b]
MRALFVGLCTLDVITRVDHVPAPNEKLAASAQLIAAGGPATNAAATFAHLGGEAVLLTAFGGHPLSAAIDEDLAALGVAVLNLTADSPEPPAVSTILVTESTGDRAVASPASARPTPPDDLEALVASADLVLIDAHHPALALPAVRHARAAGIPTLLDAGSWRPGTAPLLPYTDLAVCSADFRPPGTSSPADVLAYLRGAGVPWPIVTRGPLPVLWADGEVPVPAPTTVADTLGAGDIFHGALAHALLTHVRTRLTPALLTTALRSAAATASRSCASFGTRAWMRS